MIYPGDCPMYIWKECVLGFCCMVFHRYLLAFSWFMVLFKSSISFLIFCLLYPLLKMKFWSHQLLLLHCIFSLQFSVFAFCILGSLSTYIYVYNCYKFLINWPLYDYRMSFFLSLVKIFVLNWYCFKVCFFPNSNID